MHGIGNDYIYFDCFEEELKDPEAVAVRLSDRHFSVGGDGIVLILPSEVADAKMRMFNADGSEGKMCGNAIRCVGKYLYEKRGIHKEKIFVETLSGIKELSLDVKDGQVELVTVDMGAPIFLPKEIPANFGGDRAVNVPLNVDGETYLVTCLSMGNPHCVVFTKDVENLPLETLGKKFEHHPAFPQRVNTEFVEVKENGLMMRVWERGSGETLACGTGACAAAVAAVVNGYQTTNREIPVRLRGGELKIVYTGERVYLRGPAAFSFEGTAEL